MNDEDLKKIGDKMVRVVEPIYSELDKINQKLDEHTGKIDALSVEMHDVHQELGIFKDQVNSEIDKIKVHIGLPSTSNNS